MTSNLKTVFLNSTPRSHKSLLLFCILLLAQSGYSQIFQEISGTLNMDHVVEESAKLGGGVAFFDYDNDGDDDLYLTGGAGRDQLFSNEGDGTFFDVSFSAGIGLTGQLFTSGIITGDIDNDGDRDIYLTTTRDVFGDLAPNLLLINNGNGNFSERGQVAGVDVAARSFGATFFDYDQDSYLDLYVVNYVESSEFTRDTLENGEPGEANGYAHTCYENVFYHNNGDGTFTDRTAELGLSDRGCGLAVSASDYDSDDDLDLFVVNDFGEFVEPNALFQNEYPQDTFIDVAANTRADVKIYGMGIAIADYDLDNDLDYYFTNIGRNSFLENMGDAGFIDVADTAGVDNTWIEEPFTRTTSWGTAFIDYNNDTYPDLFVANGQIETFDFNRTGPLDPNKLYSNNGDKTFTDLTEEAGVGSTTRARGLAYADYDQDGDQDVVVTVINVPVMGEFNPHTLFYQNNSQDTNNWLQVKLEGVECNRDAYGSKIRAYVGDKILLHEINGGASHMSQSSSVAHFGLAEAVKVDSLEIAWLGGASEWAYDIDANQQLNLKQGEVQPEEILPVAVTFTVDMRGEEISSAGIYLAGDFMNENEVAQLTETDTAEVYTTTQPILPGEYEYRFINGSPDEVINFEMLTETDNCATLIDGRTVRTLTVTSERTELALDQVCFNSCAPCMINNTQNLQIVDNLFHLQPNLTTQSSWLTLPADLLTEKELYITDAMGKVVLKKSLGKFELEYQINGNQWGTGIYIVQVTANQKSQVQRLVIIK